jgi:hypothetical protein
MEAQLSQMRNDNQIRTSDHQGITIGCGARYGFRSDRRSRPGPILDHDGGPLISSHLLRQQAGDDIVAAARPASTNYGYIPLPIGGSPFGVSGPLMTGKEPSPFTPVSRPCFLTEASLRSGQQKSKAVTNFDS